MPELVVILHGQCEYGGRGRLAGRHDPDLSELGRAQADNLARIMGDYAIPDGIYSSDMCRASQTGRTVTDLRGLPRAVELPVLRERRLGVVSGMTYDEALATIPEAARFVSGTGVVYCDSVEHGFETFDELTERERKFVNYINGAYQSQETVWVFAHGDVSLGLAAATTGTTMRDLADRYYLGNGDIMRLTPGNEGVEIRRIGELAR